MSQQDTLSDLHELLGLHERGHDSIQVDSFITAKTGVDAWGMFKQALREMHSRYYTLLTQALDVREKRVELDGESRAHDGPLNELDRIKLARMYVELSSREDQFTRTLREFERFLGQARHLRKLFPDAITAAVRDELDLAHWVNHLKFEAGESLLNSRMIGGRVFRLAITLPEDQREELMGALSKPDEIVKWFKAHRPTDALTGYEPAKLDVATFQARLLNDAMLLLERGDT